MSEQNNSIGTPTNTKSSFQLTRFCACVDGGEPEMVTPISTIDSKDGSVSTLYLNCVGQKIADGAFIKKKDLCDCIADTPDPEITSFDLIDLGCAAEITSFEFTDNGCAAAIAGFEFVDDGCDPEIALFQFIDVGC